MQPPEQIRPTKLADYLEVLSKAVFQTGISWRVIEAKWPGFREAFKDFDPQYVASLSPEDVDRLAQDTCIVRNRRKIEATIANAETMLALEKEYGGFKRYLESHGSFEATSADLVKRFKFIGRMGAGYFLYVVGEPVPPHEEMVGKP